LVVVVVGVMIVGRREDEEEIHLGRPQGCWHEKGEKGVRTIWKDEKGKLRGVRGVDSVDRQ
jgi:hypothetical protein